MRFVAKTQFLCLWFVQKFVFGKAINVPAQNVYFGVKIYRLLVVRKN